MFKNEANIFEIEYKKKFPFINISLKNFFAIFIEALLIGFLAFIMETSVDIIYQNWLIDQGVLCGPFIPMYAVVLFLGLLLIKTPKRSIKNFLILFFALFIGITIVELSVGFLLEWTIHDELWDYTNMLPLSWKYISFVASFFWGIIGTLYYFYIVPIFKKIPDLIKDNADRIGIMIIFTLVIIMDCIITFTRIARNGGYTQLYSKELKIELVLFLIGIVLYIIVTTLFGIFTWKNLKNKINGKLKWVYISIYLILCVLPAFSAYNYLHRSFGFLETLATIGFLTTAFLIYFSLSSLLLILMYWFVLKIMNKIKKKEMNVLLYKKRKASITLLTMALSILICILGVIALKNPEVIHLEIGSGEKTMKIVAVSDLHYGTCGGIVELKDCVDDINELNADVVVLLGDTLDISFSKMDREYVISELNRIESKYGVYAIGGNHESESNQYEVIQKFFNEVNNVYLLSDQEVLINNEIKLIGRLDSHFISRKSLKEIDVIEGDYPIIVLDHQPQSYQEAQDYKVNLQLSGHTHNGQLWPGNLFVGLYYQLRYGCNKIDGFYQDGDFSLYTTSGYGAWGFPMKTVGRSQILEIEFKYE